jgi:hypothetical protein
LKRRRNAQPGRERERERERLRERESERARERERERERERGKGDEIAKRDPLKAMRLITEPGLAPREERDIGVRYTTQKYAFRFGAK